MRGAVVRTQTIISIWDLIRVQNIMRFCSGGLKKWRGNVLLKQERPQSARTSAPAGIVTIQRERKRIYCRHLSLSPPLGKWLTSLWTVCVDVQTTRVPQELSQLQNMILLSFRSNVDDTKERKGKERNGEERNEMDWNLKQLKERKRKKRKRK